MKSKLTWFAIAGVAGLACLVWRAEVMATARNSASTEVLGDVSSALLVEHWKAEKRDQEQSGTFIDRMAESMLLKKFDWRFIHWVQGEKPVGSNAFESELLKEIPQTKPTNSNLVFADRESPDGKQRISYVPIYAKSSCMACHAAVVNASKLLTSDDDTPTLAAGDLMAVAVISIPHGRN